MLENRFSSIRVDQVKMKTTYALKAQIKRKTTTHIRITLRSVSVFVVSQQLLNASLKQRLRSVIRQRRFSKHSKVEGFGKLKVLRGVQVLRRTLRIYGMNQAKDVDYRVATASSNSAQHLYGVHPSIAQFPVIQMLLYCS